MRREEGQVSGASAIAICILAALALVVFFDIFMPPKQYEALTREELLARCQERCQPYQVGRAFEGVCECNANFKTLGR